MAQVRVYPLNGYGHWSAERIRTGGLTVAESIYTGDMYVIGTGEPLARGVFVTPVFARTDIRWKLLHDWIELITGGDYMQLVVPGPSTDDVPASSLDDANPLVPGTVLHAVCVEYVPPTRNAAGEETGARIRWSQVDSATFGSENV